MSKQQPYKENIEEMQRIIKKLYPKD